MNFRITAESEVKRRIGVYNTEFNVAVARMLGDTNETVRSAALDILGELERDVVALHSGAISDRLLDASPTVREDALYTLSKLEPMELIKYRSVVQNMIDREQYIRVRDSAARVIHAMDISHKTDATAAFPVSCSKSTSGEAARLSLWPPSSAQDAADIRVNVRKIELLQYGTPPGRWSRA